MACCGGLLACLAAFTGENLETSAAAASEDDIQTTLKNFTKVYALVEQNFAEPVDPDKAIYKGAIPGMLRTLDPHSNFFDPQDFQLLREDQKGHYYGVGMTGGAAQRQDHRDGAVSPVRPHTRRACARATSSSR